MVVRGAAVLETHAEDPKPPDDLSDRTQHTEQVGRSLVVGLVIAALAAGTLFRVWFLFHEGVGADEATIGLMARAITHGHFSAFFWGQDYGGAEAYVVSLGFFVAGASIWVIKGTAIALFAVSALLTYFLTRRLTRSKIFGLGGRRGCLGVARG